MKISSRKTKQQGAVLMVMLAIFVLGSAYLLVSHLNPASGFTVVNRDHNAKVLSQAKAALIGYVAHQAAQSGEDDPGALPCPEANGDVGTANEGRPGPNCTLPAVGRLPWKKLGLDKLVDAASEPLWYVVSPGWAKPNSTTNTVINSNRVGQLTVNGTIAVALIIAPGQAMNTTCTPPKNQVRGAPAPGINALDYIECLSGTSYSADGNDQIVMVTAADMLPAIEAAIAARFERDVAPQMRAVYSGAAWGGAAVLPFAVSFEIPTATGFNGAPSTAGLLPFSHSETAPGSGTPCTPATVPDRCQPGFVRWTGVPTVSGPNIQGASCSVTTSTVSVSPPADTTRIDCTFRTRAEILNPGERAAFTLVGSAANVGAAFRQINTAVSMPGVETLPRGASGVLNAGGSATMTLTAEVRTNGGLGALLDAACGILPPLDLIYDCREHSISVPITLLADHPLALDTGIASAYGWFLRNRWHEAAYYAVAAGFVPGGGSSCVTSSTCLNVTYHPDDGKQRALIVLPGRALAGQSRTTNAVIHWLEGANDDGISPFTLRSPGLMINRSFNDRIAVIDQNP